VEEGGACNDAAVEEEDVENGGLGSSLLPKVTTIISSLGRMIYHLYSMLSSRGGARKCCVQRDTIAQSETQSVLGV
jgi:hypothetical protein